MTSTAPADTALAVWVPGIPAPQGSKKAMPRYAGRGGDRVFTGKVSLVESAQGVKPWREDIRGRLLANGVPGAWPLDGAVAVDLEFVLKRPTSTPKRRTPPAIKKPDVDKLERAVLDAIGSAGVWRDDSQVTDLRGRKRLAELDEVPGCLITITPEVAV